MTNLRAVMKVKMLLRDCRTSVKRLQYSCQEITALLSRNYRTPVKRLQHSYQEIAALLSRDCSTPIKRLQHSCQEIAALLSRDDSTPINKMIQYLNFFLLCILFTLLCYLNVRTKRYINPFKMVEDNVNFIFSDDPPQPDSKDKSFSNAFSPEIASCIWVRFTPKKKLTNLEMKKWINFLIIMKLSSQVRW